MSSLSKGQAQLVLVKTRLADEGRHRYVRVILFVLATISLACLFTYLVGHSPRKRTQVAATVDGELYSESLASRLRLQLTNRFESSSTNDPANSNKTRKWRVPDDAITMPPPIGRGPKPPELGEVPLPAQPRERIIETKPGEKPPFGAQLVQEPENKDISIPPSGNVEFVQDSNYQFSRRDQLESNLAEEAYDSVSLAVYVLAASLTAVTALLVIRISHSEDAIQEEIDKMLSELSVQEVRLTEIGKEVDDIRAKLGPNASVESLDRLAEIIETNGELASAIKVNGLRAIEQYKQKREELVAVNFEISRLEVKTRKLSLSRFRITVGILFMAGVLALSVGLLIVDWASFRYGYRLGLLMLTGVGLGWASYALAGSRTMDEKFLIETVTAVLNPSALATNMSGRAVGKK